MKQYLDIPSLIKSDYYSNHSRLNWHVGQLDYDKFSKDLYSWPSIWRT